MDREIITCDLAAFVGAYLPFVPEDDAVSACLQQIRKNSATRDRRIVLEGHPDDNQSQLGASASSERRDAMGVTQNPVAHLTAIAASVGASAIDGRELRYRLYDCPASESPTDFLVEPVDETRHSLYGNRMILTSSNVTDTADLDNTDIAVVCGWKAQNEHEKRLSGCELVTDSARIMNKDARRMFSFGITVDAEDMRLWYFSRSHSAASQPFHYIEHPRLLIQALMALMFSTEEEMGYDPTVTRHANGSFTYALPGRFFRTGSIIYQYPTNNIAGSRTRVWLVDEVDSAAQNANVTSGHQYVLKDVWIEETALTEKQIQDTIFDDIERFWNTPLSEDKAELAPLRLAHADLVESKLYKEYFLAIEADDIGNVTKPAAAYDETERNFGYGRKKKYRVIFKERCEAVGDLETLGEVFDVVQQTLIPLQLMFCAGWVHRDISSGNILAYRDTPNGSWTTKLADLEYAKRFPPSDIYIASKDPKMFTPYFMPHEILAQEYIYTAPAREELITVEEMFMDVPSKPFSKSTIVHNFGHDLESLWWLLLWSITARTCHAPAQEFAKFIFQNNMTLSVDRRSAFETSIRDQLLQVLTEPAGPSLSKFMDAARVVLYRGCKEREINAHLFNPSVYVKVQEELGKCFTLLYSRGDSSWRRIELNSLHSSNVNAVTSTLTEQPKAPTPSALSNAKRPRFSEKYPLGPTQGTSEEDVSSTKYKRARQ